MDNLNNFNTGINTSPDKFNKKQIIIGAAAILVLLIVGLIVYFNRKNRIEAPPAAPQETLIEKQAKELDALNKQAGVKPLTEEELKKQAEELEELNNLRSQ